MNKPNQIPGLQVRLINLPRSTLRREQMQLRLAELGLPYELFNAIDGAAQRDQLFETVDLKAFQRNVGRDVLPGEIGCYHSHLSVWRAFLESKDDVLLVLEDDVVFGTDFLFALNEAMRVREHWDFLKLNKIRAKQPVCQAKVGPYSLNAYVGPATGLGAYLINRGTVQRLLPAILPITRPIDHELDLIHVHDFRHFGLEPFPSYVDDNNESTITGKTFSAVKKYDWYRRLPAYSSRLKNQWLRLKYLAVKGRLRNSPKVIS